jgi:hypothetical protein
MFMAELTGPVIELLHDNDVITSPGPGARGGIQLTVPIYFDWSDSSLAHPFFSAANFLEFDDIPHTLLPISDLRTRLRDAYLEPWTIYEPIERLAAAFTLAQQVAPVHHALTYHLLVLPAMESLVEDALYGGVLPADAAADLTFRLRCTATPAGVAAPPASGEGSNPRAIRSCGRPQ